MNKYIKPQHFEVSEGQSAKFTCQVTKSSGSVIWRFNQMYPLSWDIRRENNSIIIDYVRLNHTGSYSCSAIKLNYKLLQWNFEATATLKVFGKQRNFKPYCILH